MEKKQSSKQKGLDDRLEKEIRELLAAHVKGFKQKIQDDLPEREAGYLIGRLEEEFSRSMWL